MAATRTTLKGVLTAGVLPSGAVLPASPFPIAVVALNVLPRKTSAAVSLRHSAVYSAPAKRPCVSAGNVYRVVLSRRGRRRRAARPCATSPNAQGSERVLLLNRRIRMDATSRGSGTILPDSANPGQASTELSGARRPLPIGAACLSDGGVHFRVWAPHRSRVAVVLGDERAGQTVPLVAEGNGYFSATSLDAGPGTRYRFRLDEDPTLHPDPASRFQPEGPSRSVPGGRSRERSPGPTRSGRARRSGARSSTRCTWARSRRSAPGRPRMRELAELARPRA